jgi:hypothetical protein
MKCFITNRECKYDRPFKGPQLDAHVFMISPFGFPFDDLYWHGIEPTFKNALGKTISRADQSLQLGYVMCQRICRRILASTYAFADLTEPNGNVYYELGLAFGLGKHLAVIWNRRSHNPFVSPYVKAKLPAYKYGSLHDLQSKEAFTRLMTEAYVLPSNIREQLRVSSPHVILRDPPVILNIVNDDCPSPDFHEVATVKAIEHFNSQVGKGTASADDGKKQLEPWRIETLVVGEDLRVTEAVTKMAKAKICLIDVTHYEERTNANIFFLLGVAHATEREVIPIINRPLNRSVPFDIRGLWQINYEKTDELERELEQILPVIDFDFRKEKVDFLYRRIWDPFLAHKAIHVITCAREAPSNEDRGKRTDIDMWDFNSVSRLAFFIAQKYETAEVHIDQPKNKKASDELAALDQRSFHAALRDELAGKDCLIIGSPDVSDYAEVVLADIHGLVPHRKPRSARKPPFLFVKQTRNTNNPRRDSAFYVLPEPGDKKDRVHFGVKGRTCIECVEYEDDEGGKPVHMGHSCVVITFTENPYASEGDKEKHHIMVFSGFTGVATFAAIELLTLDKYRSELKRYLEAYKELMAKTSGCIRGVNVLVSVDYRKPSSSVLSGDNRELTAVHFKDAELILFSGPVAKTNEAPNNALHRIANPRRVGKRRRRALGAFFSKGLQDGKGASKKRGVAP